MALPVLAWLVPLALAVFAGERAIRARRTRRQTVGVLARLPEPAGEFAVTESGLSAQIAQVVQDAANAPRGQAPGAAIAAPMACGVASGPLDDPAPAAGTLFRTGVDYPSGDERQPAQALVPLIQQGIPRA